jgi:hypothetical protein
VCGGRGREITVYALMLSPTGVCLSGLLAVERVLIQLHVAHQRPSCVCRTTFGRRLQEVRNEQTSVSLD